MDITLRSAQAQAAAIAAGDISAVELLDAVLDRYERFNPIINAVVVERVEGARRRAVEADQALVSGQSWGMLHGVPITIKESFDWVGTPSTSGHPHRLNYRPKRNDETVQRLLDTGAVIYGKTNLPVAMADWQTFNSIYGTTRNPWDPRLIPGGSSGGSAAALAAGLAALELGSDIGASIRNPAHYCGVFGHKPTYGLVPTAGHGNPGSPVSLDIGVAGPMARSAVDLRLGLDVLAGAAGLDARAWRLELPETRWERPDQVKAAVMLESPCVKQDRELTDCLLAAVEALADLGVQIDFDARPEFDVERAHEVYIALLRSATGTELSPRAFEAHRDDAGRYSAGERDFRARAAKAITMTHWEWAAIHTERERMRLAWDEFFGRYDLLLCPAAASAAYPHDQVGERVDRTIIVNGEDQSTMDQLFWAGFSCGVYLPATVAPAGLTRSGLPCGLQIVAAHARDYESIAFAAFMERELGGYMTPPGYA